MKKHIYPIVAVVVVSVAVWLSGCGDDECVVCPPEQEKEFQFLYSWVGGFYDARVYTYSTLTGAVVDTAYYGTEPFKDARFSKDGKYVYYTVDYPPPGATWITEYGTGDTLAIAPGIWGHWLQLFPDEKYLLLSGGGMYLRVLSLPNLEIVYQEYDSSGFRDAGTHPTDPVAYVPKDSEDSLLILDIWPGVVQRRTVAIKTSDGSPARSFNATVTKDGSTLILSVDYYPYGGGGGFLQLRRTSDFSLLREYWPGRSTAYLHPDGSRVYFREPARYQTNTPGSIWELDLKTFLMKRILDGSNVIGSGWPLSGVNPADLAIDPAGKYLLAINGGGGLGAFGPILKIDLSTYKIVDVTDPPLGIPRKIRMYPIEK